MKVEREFASWDKIGKPVFEREQIYFPNKKSSVYLKNKNWGEILLIPDFGYYFWNEKRKASLIENGVTTFGIHGYDSKYKEMHGIFYANGPAFKDGYEIPAIKNIHIYPLMCEILGLKIPESIDGDLNEIKNVLKGDH